MMPQEVRTLVLGNMILAGVETGKVKGALLAEGMARALRAANEQQEAALDRGRLRVFYLYERIASWIRDTLDQAHDEVTFGEVLTHYEEALAQHSFEAVAEEVAELPSSVVLRIHERIPELMEAQPTRPSPVGEMQATGEFLGMGLRQLYLGAVLFGAQKGLFQPGDFGVAPQDIEKYWGADLAPEAAFVLVDAEYWRTLRRFEAVRDHVQRDWGSLHPLVRGFYRTQGVQHLRQAVEEVGAYLTQPRH